MTASAVCKVEVLCWRVEFDLKGAFAISILTLVVNKVSGFEGLWVVGVCLSLGLYRGGGIGKVDLWVVWGLGLFLGLFLLWVL